MKLLETIKNLKIGISIWVGPGWIIHLSTDSGNSIERAEHGTWRIGFLIAKRKNLIEKKNN